MQIQLAGRVGALWSLAPSSPAKLHILHTAVVPISCPKNFPLFFLLRSWWLEVSHLAVCSRIVLSKMMLSNTDAHMFLFFFVLFLFTSLEGLRFSSYLVRGLMACLKSLSGSLRMKSSDVMLRSIGDSNHFLSLFFLLFSFSSELVIWRFLILQSAVRLCYQI